MVGFINDHRGQYGVEPICSGAADRPVDVLSPARADTSDPTRRAARAQRDDELRDRDSARLGRELPGLRAAEGLAAVAARGHPGGPLHGRAPDAGDGAAGRRPGPGVGHDHPAGGRRRPAGRPGRPRLHGDPPEPALGGRLHVRRDLARVCLRRVRHRRLCAADCRAGGCRRRCAPTSCWMRWSRRSTTGAATRRPGWCITAIAAPSTCRCATPTAWPTPASRRRWAVAGIRMTTPSPNR